jgi:myo-inositol-1(or 4)-monophosphatase
VSQGVRRLGAAAVDLCHVSLGIVDAYWEYRLKPWDVAAGVVVLQEAGGRVTTMDGQPYRCGMGVRDVQR